MIQHFPDRPNFEHPDVAGETQAWCSICGHDAEDCICSDSMRSSASWEAATQKGQAIFEASIHGHCFKCKRDRWLNDLNLCRKCAATPLQPEQQTQPQPILARSTGVPADAEEGYCAWIDETERNQRENQRQEEEREWARQVQLQEETDDR